MTSQRISRISRSNLDSLITALKVGFVNLTDCLVSPGWRLALAASDAPGIHYNLGGVGRLIIGEQPPIEPRPHTLVIVPRAAFRDRRHERSASSVEMADC